MLGMLDCIEHWIFEVTETKIKETEIEYERMLLAYCIDFFLVYYMLQCC